MGIFDGVPPFEWVGKTIEFALLLPSRPSEFKALTQAFHRICSDFNGTYGEAERFAYLVKDRLTHLKNAGLINAPGLDEIPVVVNGPDKHNTKGPIDRAFQMVSKCRGSLFFGKDDTKLTEDAMDNATSAFLKNVFKIEHVKLLHGVSEDSYDNLIDALTRFFFKSLRSRNKTYDEDSEKIRSSVSGVNTMILTTGFLALKEIEDMDDGAIDKNVKYYLNEYIFAHDQFDKEKFFFEKLIEITSSEGFRASFALPIHTFHESVEETIWSGMLKEYSKDTGVHDSECPNSAGSAFYMMMHLVFNSIIFENAENKRWDRFLFIFMLTVFAGLAIGVVFEYLS